MNLKFLFVTRGFGHEFGTNPTVVAIRHVCTGRRDTKLMYKQNIVSFTVFIFCAFVRTFLVFNEYIWIQFLFYLMLVYPRTSQQPQSCIKYTKKREPSKYNTMKACDG